MFEQGGDLFLAQERIAGTTLRAWYAEQTRGTKPGLPWPALHPVIRKLTDLLAAVHDLGIVLYDFTPANILVRADGSFALVDLEFATRLGESPSSSPGRCGNGSSSSAGRKAGISTISNWRTELTSS